MQAGKTYHLEFNHLVCKYSQTSILEFGQSDFNEIRLSRILVRFLNVRHRQDFVEVMSLLQYLHTGTTLIQLYLINGLLR